MLCGVQVYSVDKVARQLEELAAESGHMLLFLRSIQTLRVLRWAAGAAGPQLLHTCSVQVLHRTLQGIRCTCALPLARVDTCSVRLHPALCKRTPTHQICIGAHLFRTGRGSDLQLHGLPLDESCAR